MLFNSLVNILKFNEHITKLQRETYTLSVGGVCGFGVNSVSILVPCLKNFFWFYYRCHHVAHKPSEVRVCLEVLTHTDQKSLEVLCLFSGIGLIIRKQILHCCTQVLLCDESHKQDSKIHPARTGTNLCLHFLHCTECPLHSPIYNNQVCCRKLNIVTWSYDIKQAVWAENHKQGVL